MTDAEIDRAAVTLVAARRDNYRPLSEICARATLAGIEPEDATFDVLRAIICSIPRNAAEPQHALDLSVNWIKVLRRALGPPCP